MTRIKACFRLVVLLALFVFPLVGKAQLDYIHYVPPMYNGSTTVRDIGRNVAVITTDSRDLIEVSIFLGGGTLHDKINVSRSAPYRYVFKTQTGSDYGTVSNSTTYNFPLGVIGANELNKPLPNAGLKFRSYDAPIYVNIRHATQDQGGSLTTKGRFAKGKEFRSGHIYTDAMNAASRRSHFISIMATEDNTKVNFSDIQTGILTDFTLPSNRLILPASKDIPEITLNEGESYVIAVDHDLSGFDSNKRNDMNGTHIVSDKDIVVSTGSWTSGPSNGQDIGVDQIVPYDQIRDEYVVMKGQGDNTTERPIVVATVDDTYIYINGNSTPINLGAPLAAGEFLAVAKSYYSLNNGIYTMMIDTRDKNVYVYQTMSGSSTRIGPTVGMNFIPPLSATGMHQVDIPFSDQLAKKDVYSVITILAQKGASLQYENTIGVTTTTTEMLESAAAFIKGTDEWVSYKLNNVEGNIRIQSSRALNVAWTVQSGVVGAAGYYSGFSKAISKIIPDLHVDLETDLGVICESYNENIEVGITASPIPDFYEWYENETTEANLLFESEKLIVPAPDVPTNYIAKAYFRDPTLDILYNGDFSSGRGNFETDYSLVSGNLRLPGNYALTFTPQSENASFEDFDDMEGGGLMLIVYSDGQGKTIYKKLDTPVDRNTNYILKVHGRMAQLNSPQLLDIYINEEKIKSNFLIDDATTWQSVSALWKSKDNQKATISLVDANSSGNSGVFAIDSITLVPAVVEEAVFNALVVPNYSFTPYNEPLHFCLDKSGDIDISNGDVSWYNYLWEKKSGDSFVAITDETITGIDSHKLVFTNVINSNEGIYRCTINFKDDYAQCGVGVDPAQMEVEVKVDQPATLQLLVEDTDLCEGETTTLQAIVGGDNSGVRWFVNDKETPGSKVFDFNSDKTYPAGVYTIRCDVGNACTPLSKEISIQIFARPEVNDLLIPENLCDKTSAELTAVVNTMPIGASMTYNWYRDETLLGSGTVPTYTVLPHIDDSYYKVDVAAYYDIGQADKLVCKGNELTEKLGDIYPQVVLSDLEDVSLCEGESYTYKAKLSTLGDYYTYNWEIPFVTEDDKTGSDFVLGVVTPEMAGNYKVTVSNRCGSAIASSDLSVTPKLLVTDISLDKTGPYCLNESVEITITDNGEASDYYAENLTTGEIINPISNPYNFVVTDLKQGRWKITAEGSCGTRIDQEFDIYLVEDFSDPSLDNITTCFGENVNFEVQIVTIPIGSVLTYVWTDPNGNPITVSDPFNIINIPDVQDADLGVYTCVVSNQCGYSKTVTANLDAEKVISTQTASALEVCQGKNNYRFDIDYIGSPTFSWRFDDPTGTVIGVLDHYEIATVETTDAGIYYCDITLSCGNIVKYQRELIVNDNITVTEETPASVNICQGGQVELRISTTGAESTIQWFDNDDNELLAYSGKTRLSTGVINTPGTYTYKYKLTDDCENPFGDFDVVVHTKPTINPIAAIEACEGNIALNMVITGTDYTASSWWNTDESTKLGDGLSHTLVGATYPGSSDNYVALVNTAYCGDVKTTAQVEVYEPITVLSNSKLNPTPCVGDALSLVVNGYGADLSYNWYKTDAPGVSLSSDKTLDLGVADLGDEGNYRCELISGNACGNVSVDFGVDVREHASITNPVLAPICEGDGPANLSITATVEGSARYQWFDNDGSISGANSDNLSIVDLVGNDGQSYYCKVSDGLCDAAESEKTSLIVNRNVVIIKDPSDILIAENGIANFIVEAEGTEPFSYQWYENGVLLGGKTSSTLTIDPAHIGLNGRKYKCLVSNVCSTDVASAEATLTVDSAIKITTQPVNTEICEGGTFEFVVKHKPLGVGKTCYWEYNDGFGFKPIASLANHIIILDGNSVTLRISDATIALKDYLFRATVEGLTSPDDDDVSNEVEVKVYQPVAFNDIKDVEICKDAGVSFGVNGLTGTGPFIYDWKRVATNIGSNSSLNLNAADASDGSYSVIVSNGICPSHTEYFEISHYEDLIINSISNIDPVCLGVGGDLVVNISKDDALTINYQWFKDDDVTVLSSEAIYTVPGLDESESGLYKIVVSDACGAKSQTTYINALNEITATITWDALKKFCVGDELLLEAKVSGDNPTYTWTAPNGRAVGNVAILKIDEITEADAGIYICEISGTCGTPVIYTTTVDVNKVPNITTGIENLAVLCEGQPLILGPIGYDAITGETISWKFNDEIISGETNLTLNPGLANVSNAGNYRVEVSNACGDDFSLGYQAVDLLPTLDAMDNQVACQGEDVVFRAVATGDNLTYRWFVDGDAKPLYDDKAELVIPNILSEDLNSIKTYEVECKVSACGINLNTIAYVDVKPNTILYSSINGGVVYVGSNHEFSLNVTGHELSYEWHHINAAGDDIKLSETSPTLQLNNLDMTNSGEYSCIITSDCGIRFTSGYLSVKDPLKIVNGLNNLTEIEKCFGDPLNLNISVKGEVYSIDWFKDDVNLDHHELNYFISVLDTDDTGSYRCEINGEGANLSEKVNLIVYESTVMKSHLGDQNLCEDQNLLWIPNVVGSKLTYDWQYKGMSISDQASLNIPYVKMDQAGDYRVDISGKCGNVSSDAHLELQKQPYYISHSDNLEVCENAKEAIFTVNYGGDKLTYQWRKDGENIDGANSSVLQIQNIKFSDVGIYNCAVNSSCGKEFLSPNMQLSVIPLLKTLSESGDIEICEGENADFSVEVEGRDVIYQWQFNGDDITGANAPNYQINSSSIVDRGYYTCELSDKCTSKRYSDSKRLDIHALPNSQIYGRMELCVLEDRVTYTTSIQPDISYMWQVEGGEFTTATAGVKTKITWGELNDGNIKIKVSDEATGCYFEVDSLITLHSLPEVNLSEFDSYGVCESTFELQGGFPEGGIYWVNGTRERSFEPSQGHGTYPIRYSYTDENGCSNISGEKVLIVDSLPEVKVIEDVNVGACKTQQLWAETEQNNIKWSPSRYLDNPGSKTPIFTSGESERYVAFVVDKHGCLGTDIVNVTVAPLPVITTINDTVIGQCKTLVLTTDIVGDIAGINWTSDRDHINESTVRDPILDNLSVGLHNYTINVSDMYGCLASSSVKVDVRANPELDETKFLCEGDSYTINIRNFENPVWNDGYMAWERVIDQPGEYILSVSNEFGCGKQQKIVLHPTPVINLRDTLIFEGESVILNPDLDANYEPYVYNWDNGSLMPELEVDQSNTYRLSVEDNIGCVALDSAIVVVNPVGIESPNAFTPGSGNENNHFYLKEINIQESFEMYVYNRWGELVHKTSEAGYNGGWDGTYRGEKCPTGVYVWILILNGKMTEKGNLVLVR